MSEIGERRIGTISRKEEICKVCIDCGKEFWGRMDKNYMTCRDCGIKVGKTVAIGGFNYIRLSADDPYYSMSAIVSNLMGRGWVRLSRYTMAKHLGRCLTENEQVWHKSKNKLDDALENLELHTFLPKPEQTEEQTRGTRAYKFGYEEGFEAGYEEATGGRKCPPQLETPADLPRMPKKITSEEARVNLEYWQEEARKRKEADYD